MMKLFEYVVSCEPYSSNWHYINITVKGSIERNLPTYVSLNYVLFITDH